MSAIGTAVANNLTRAGVGFLRLIDGDYIDVSELQRQSLFTEEDAHEPLLQRFCQSDNSFFQIRIKKIVIIHITPSLN